MLKNVEFTDYTKRIEYTSNFWSESVRKYVDTMYDSVYSVFEGVYVSDNLNLNHSIEQELDNSTEAYSVADDIDQILKYHKDLIDSDRKFVLLCVIIFKEHQSPTGDWRWHKWGEYIGTQEPTSEYLYDEPDIDHVYIYEFIEIK